MAAWLEEAMSHEIGHVAGLCHTTDCEEPKENGSNKRPQDDLMYSSFKGQSDANWKNIDDQYRIVTWASPD